MRGKIFSPSEASQMVPLIRRIVVNIRSRHRLVARKEEEFAGLGESEADRRRRHELLQTLRKLREEQKSYESELEALGCFLRDAEAGVVECYGELEGEIVYFSWRPGHGGFESWHPLDDSHLNRQPLPGIKAPKAHEAAE